jgi:membrane fusion protein, multidrug efflux system
MPPCPTILRRHWLAAAACAAVLAGGCSSEAPPVAATDEARPAEILEVGAAGPESGLRFPGRVRAAQRAELTFSVPGKLVELPVREGQQVAAGALIARLDPASYQTRLASAQAEFDKAKSDYERVRTIWERSKAVAQVDVDQKRTAMEVARSTLAAARKDVADTRLTAPFAGVVARRHVENFQNVQAKEPIVSLQDSAQLEVVIHVPERVVRGEPRRAEGYATFEGVPDRRFPVKLKSIATEADPQTQTYEVVLGLPVPAGVKVLPGMSATIFPQEASEPGTDAVVRVPVEAVFADAEGVPQVWVVDAETSRVAARTVETGALEGGEVVVIRGLSAGERIVTAGVHHLRAGMRVRPL